MMTVTHTKTRTRNNENPRIKKQHRLKHKDVVTEVLGEIRKSGKHKYPQSTFRLDDDTRQKLEEMAQKVDANQVDVVVFALKQMYLLFEDEGTTTKISAVIPRKLQKKKA